MHVHLVHLATLDYLGWKWAIDRDKHIFEANNVLVKVDTVFDTLFFKHCTYQLLSVVLTMLFIWQGHKGVKGEAGEPGKQGHMVRTHLSLLIFLLLFHHWLWDNFTNKILSGVQSWEAELFQVPIYNAGFNAKWKSGSAFDLKICAVLVEILCSIVNFVVYR